MPFPLIFVNSCHQRTKVSHVVYTSLLGCILNVVLDDPMIDITVCAIWPSIQLGAQQWRRYVVGQTFVAGSCEL